MRQYFGFSVIEYLTLFVIIILAVVAMREHIQRGIFGLWGQTGQGFANGRQYDPQRSIECSFDPESGLWYDDHCFTSASVKQGCHSVTGDFCADSSACSSGQCADKSICGPASCEEAIITSGACAASYCNQMNPP